MRDAKISSIFNTKKFSFKNGPFLFILTELTAYNPIFYRAKAIKPAGIQKTFYIKA
jgi:hypothetical protein